MKGVFALVAILSFLGFGSAAVAQKDMGPAGVVCTLTVEGMACSACAARVQKEAMKIAGVTVATVSQPKGTAEITFDASKTSPAAIAKVITDKTGFKAEVRGTKK
ncbi:MAG TPA: heavy-metal-associated domain-containing protein [Vicinamibacterales bacterium]|nr:heavy-metal-associated domain-containing protein [Vicinamibacterales bacterium]